MKPDIEESHAWDTLDKATQERLFRVWMHGDRETYRVMRDSALAHAAAHKRSVAHGDRRRMDVFTDRAARNGVNPRDLAAFVDLSDLPADVRQRLIDLRQREGLAAFACALGEARIAARNRQSAHPTQ